MFNNSFKANFYKSRGILHNNYITIDQYIISTYSHIKPVLTTEVFVSYRYCSGSSTPRVFGNLGIAN